MVEYQSVELRQGPWTKMGDERPLALELVGTSSRLSLGSGGKSLATIANPGNDLRTASTTVTTTI